MQESIYIIAPAYNEAEYIETFVNCWYPTAECIGEESRLVVIDDGSKDDTFAILQEMQKTRPLLVPLTKPNGGHGSTVLFGYRYALEHDAEYIFQTDSDGQTNPAEFPAFWKSRLSYDAIFGNRTQRGDGGGRAAVEWVVCALVKHYFGSSVPDANAPFRLMRRHYVEAILPFMPDDYNLPNIVLTALGQPMGFDICFKEISFAPRTTGKNSINLKKIIGIGTKALGDFRNIKSGFEKHGR